jgi:membrane protease YdiL (CAAX protease family)
MGEGPTRPLNEASPHDRAPEPKPVLVAAMATAGMVVFGMAAHSSFPTFLLALAGLSITTLAIGLSFRSGLTPSELFGTGQVTGSVVLLSCVGLCLGAGLAFLLRFTSHQPLLLSGFRPFVLSAAAIGAAEELLFRGFVQGRLTRLGWPAAVVLAALAHTAYKSSLFLFPTEGWTTNLPVLALFTFLGGVVFGWTRQVSASVFPPLVAHVLFDILVYGDWAGAPWWVWG